MPQRATHPNVKWNGETISVTLPDMRGHVIKAKWNPGVTSVVRIREVGADEWSPGFETPLTTCQFRALKPDTEYEFEVRFKNAAGEGRSTRTRARTGPDGMMGKVIPFFPPQ